MKYSSFLLLICFLWASCKKETPTVNGTSYGHGGEYHYDFYPNSSTIADFLWQPGTWWVYKDLADNSRDSIWVSSTVATAVDYYPNPFGPSNKDTNHGYTIFLSGATHETTSFVLMNYGLYKHWASNYDYNSFFSYLPDSVKASACLGFYDTLTVQGNLYSNVSKVLQQGYHLPEGPSSDSNYLYVNKTYGIIKKEIYDHVSHAHKTYELINVNIVH